jgi:hypothetical protein
MSSPDGTPLRSTTAATSSSTNMKQRVFFSIALVALFALPMRGGFDEVVNAISKTSGLHRTPIPFFGLARFVVRVGHPHGVHDIQLATFEGGGTVDRRDVAAILRDSIRDGYHPIVQTRSNRDGEFTFIYARPDGNTIDMLIVTHDHSDTTVVRAVVDGDVFAKEVNGEHVTRGVGAK